MTRGLALDLDGTLLRPDDSISDRDRQAVAAAVDAGWSVVLATARWYQLAERTARSLGLVDPVIACSGAEVRRLHDGVDLLDVRLPAAFTAELYAVCEAHDGVVMVYEDRDVAVRSATATPRAARDAPDRLAGRCRADAARRARVRRRAVHAACSTRCRPGGPTRSASWCR